MCSTQNKGFTRVSGLVTPLGECQQCSSTPALAGKPLRSLFIVVGTKNCPDWVTDGTLGLLSVPFEETTTGHGVAVVAGSGGLGCSRGATRLPRGAPLLPGTATRSTCSMLCLMRTWL